MIKSRLKNEFDKNDILKDSNCKFILENKNLKARNATLEKELEGRIQLLCDSHFYNLSLISPNRIYFL